MSAKLNVLRSSFKRGVSLFRIKREKMSSLRKIKEVCRCLKRNRRTRKDNFFPLLQFFILNSIISMFGLYWGILSVFTGDIRVLKAGQSDEYFEMN